MNKTALIWNRIKKSVKLILIITFILPFSCPTLAAAETRTLSLEDCFQMALRYNLGLKINRFSLQKSEPAVTGAKASFDPYFF